MEIKYNKIPNSIIRKIKREAPSYTYGESFGRYNGIHSESNEYTRSYKSIIIYVQNGLSYKFDLFTIIVKAIFKIQENNRRKYPLLVLGFGHTDNLQHEKKYFDFGYQCDAFNVNKVAETISRISGNTKITKAIIPELFPKTDIRSLYTGKIKIDSDDLLIIIGRKNEVFFNTKLKPKLNSKIRKHILFVEIDNNDIKWYFKNYEPKYLNMNVINPVENICKKVASNLIAMYPDNSSGMLIFPSYRSGKIRVSEQEARFAFVSEVVKLKDFFYAIEVPTKKRYSHFSTKPKIYDEDSNQGRSGAIDLSLFKKNEKKIPFINIEFKSGQPTQASITKDILKLVSEPHDYGIFFHVLEHSNSGTLPSLLKKLNNSFSEIKASSKKISKVNCSIIFLFIVILEENNSKCRGSYIDFLKIDKLEEKDLIKYNL